MGFIVAAIAAVVNFVVAAAPAVIAFVKANIAVVAAVAAVVAAPFIGGLFSMPDIPTGGSEAERQQGVLLTTFGSEQHIPVVYGYRKVGGNITFAETGSVDNKYLWVAYALSEGPIEGLRELFLDDHQLPASIVADLNAGKTVNISEGKYKDRVQLQFSHGVYFDNPRNSQVGTWSICSEAPSWKPSMVYNGLAVIFARYEWKKIETQEDADANPFSGAIPALQTTLLGRKVASISSATDTAYGSRTERYSTNPVEHLVDYLSNPRYGKGLLSTDIDWDQALLSANKCNQRVEYVSGVYGAILTSNIVVDTAQTLMNNTKSLLATFRGYMPFSQGEYRIRVEDAGNESDILSGSATIVRTFTEDNIIDNITFSSVDKSNKYNAVKVSYVDPDDKWSNQTVIYPESESDRAYYRGLDGGRENVAEVFFPGITNYAIAKDMARLLFNKSRFQETCAFTADSSALDLEVGDNIYIQSKHLNFSTTPWRVVSLNIKNDMSVEVGCIKNQDSIYPHTRVGEEDIVEPVYVPRGATIYYPAVQTSVAVGLAPPTNAVVPVIHSPPSIIGIDPNYFASAGVNTVTVFGTNFQTGLTAVFIGDDGTSYTPTSTTRNSTGQVTLETTASMTDANQPYDIRITNSSTYGSLSAQFNNCLNIDGSAPPAVTDPVDNPPTQDPPVVEEPDEPDITPEPTDPPDEGDGPNTQPPQEPEPEPLNDILEITQSEVFTNSVGQTFVRLTGTQPQNSAYSSVKIYYKRYGGVDTVYQQVEITTKAGGGENIVFEIGPLLENFNYEFISRVKYVTGESSERVNKFFVQTTPGEIADPRDFIEAASTGWPSDPGEFTARRDNSVDNITATTLTTGGNPRDPRELEITVSQTVAYEPANYDIAGLKIYSRSITQTAFEVNEYAFTDGYQPGNEVTFTVPNDLGNRVYPGTPTDNQQNFDFVFRWYYKDGTESTKQTRYMNVPVEVSLGSYSFNPLLTTMVIKETVDDFFITIADPSAPSAAADMTINILGVGAWNQRGSDEQRFYIQPPDTSVLNDWAGMRFRSRAVIPGQDPEFEEYTETNIQISPTAGNAFYIVPTVFEQEREWVVTPMYRSSGQRVDSTQSWYGKGYVSPRGTGPDVPSILLGDNSPNWYSKFNWRQMTTADALNTIDEAFPAPPNPRVQLLKYEVNARYNQSVWGYNDRWATIEFDHRAISGYVGLNIYRRYKIASQMDNPYVKDYGTLYGLGRWERVENTTTNASGSVTLNLRMPEDYQIFNLRSSSPNLFASYYDPATYHYVGQTTIGLEILLVAVDGSGESSIGLLLPTDPGNITPGVNGYKNMLIGRRPTEVNLTDIDGYTTALQRNLSQYVSQGAKSVVYSNREKSFPNPGDLSLI